MLPQYRLWFFILALYQITFSVWIYQTITSWLKTQTRLFFFVFNLVMCLISFGLCLLCSAFTANVGGLFLEETLWPLLWKKSNRFEVPALHVLKFMHDFYAGGKKKDLYDFYIIALRFLYLHFEKHFRTIHHMWGAWNACTTCALIF